MKTTPKPEIGGRGCFLRYREGTLGSPRELDIPTDSGDGRLSTAVETATTPGSLLEEHELPLLCAAGGFALNATLVEMLGEHFSHRTERRGSGFTQATRHLAVLVNEPRTDARSIIARLFPAWARKWSPSPSLLSDPADSEPGSAPTARAMLDLQRSLLALPDLLQREESKLLASLMNDLVFPAERAADIQELPAHHENLKVGTCPLAEKYFLEVSDGFVRRKGRVNVFVSAKGEPLLLEKQNLGDDHSCINVTQLMLNGVRLPPGCLFAVRYEPGIELRANRGLPGSVMPVGHCLGFRFLRLTTLAVSPESRARAFTSHFRAQVDAGLFAPGEATIEQLRGVAEGQL